MSNDMQQARRLVEGSYLTSERRVREIKPLPIPTTNLNLWPSFSNKQEPDDEELQELASSLEGLSKRLKTESVLRVETVNEMAGIGSEAVKIAADAFHLYFKTVSLPFTIFKHSVEVLKSTTLESVAFAVATPRPKEQDAEAKAKFDRLKLRWMREMPPSSKLERLFMCMPYQSIIGMGEAAVPFLIEEVQKEPRLWFWALEAITGANPVNPENDLTLESIGRAWVRWAAENGF